MTDHQACRELGHEWPSDMLVLAIKPQAIAEVVCTRCGIVKTTIIDDLSICVRLSLSGTVISEVVELKAPGPSPKRRRPRLLARARKLRRAGGQRPPETD